MLPEHRWPFLTVLVKDHHADARILERLALLLIQPLLLVFAALVSGSGSIWVLVALMAVYGMGEAFFRPALSGVIPQCVSSERLQEAYGLLATTPALGIAVGGGKGLVVPVLPSRRPVA